VTQAYKSFSIFSCEAFLTHKVKISITMTKNQGLLLGIALILLFTGIALATSTALTASSGVIIHAFDQNPAGSDDGNEWVTIHNPSNESVDIGNWTLSLPTAQWLLNGYPKALHFTPEPIVHTTLLMGCLSIANKL
jgi:hypothetical protein